MNDIVNQLALPIMLAVLSSNALFAFIQFLISRKDKKTDNIAKIFDELAKINEKLNSIEKRLSDVESELARNTEGTKAELYMELDKLLTKIELIGCWSSEGKQQFERLYTIYTVKLKDGLDGGRSLRERADAVQIDNQRFLEKMARYTNHKINVMEGKIQ